MSDRAIVSGRASGTPLAPRIGRRDRRVLGDAGGTVNLTATNALTLGTDLVVLGTTSSSDGTAMFATRLASDGSVVFSRRYLGCDDPRELSPTFAVAAPNDALTVVGSASGHREGFLARLQKDGAVGFSSLSTIGSELSKVLVWNAVTELPTTGFLAVGSTVDLLAGDGDPGGTPSLALASLDSVGRPLWAKRYTLPDARATGFGAVTLSDDGGAVVTGVAEHGGTPGGGLVAFKAFAKDGTLGDATGVDVTDVGVSRVDCTFSATQWDVTVSDSQPTLQPAMTEAAP